MNNKEYIKYMRDELSKYIFDNNLKSLVLGVSGGIDSALVAALAKPICDEKKIPLFGRSLPSISTSSDELNRSILIGLDFCTSFDVFSIEPMYNMLLSIEKTENTKFNELSMSMSEKIRCGNIKARIRMIYLYNLAHLHSGIVLSTDNYTELLLGFWTLHGDVGDFGMIQNLWKTEVYEISNYILNNENLNKKQKVALELCIKATPTDGLGITNSDLDQLGASSYEEVDNILKEYIKDNTAFKNHPVIKRHLASQFKRNNPYNVEFLI